MNGFSHPPRAARAPLDNAAPWIGPRAGRHPLRAALRLALVVGWSLPAMLLQAALLRLWPRAARRFPLTFWATVSRLVGVRVRVVGTRCSPRADGRPVVFVSNHSSWLDIPVLGGRLDACFIAKAEVARWPVIGTIARLGRTVYVRRTRSSVEREREDMQARLAAGDNLILFPEGTSSDGARVLPFRSAFLSIAEAPVGPHGLPPLIQPVAVVYDEADGLPVMRTGRPLFAWYGDMEIGSHLWRLVQHRGLRATVLLLPPLDPARYPDRKELARAVWQIVADAAARLRQNRPPAEPPPESGEKA